MLLVLVIYDYRTVRVAFTFLSHVFGFLKLKHRLTAPDIIAAVEGLEPADDWSSVARVRRSTRPSDSLPMKPCIVAVYRVPWSTRAGAWLACLSMRLAAFVSSRRTVGVLR